MLKIRVARDEDLEAVVQMMNGGASSQRIHLENGATDTYKPAFRAIQQCPNTDIYVGETEAGEAVATFQLTYVKGLAFNGKPRGQIESMHTRADMRGQGVGQEMLAHAIKLARDEGCCMVQLTSNKERDGAHRFYASNGFVPTHEGFKLIF
ncbi:MULTISPECIES: GNAT family N-acetyltransferase [unclassified Pseudovibrio]|uniref:GNAT family N-acetyltransferase n=1 Tax=unclassified Pseudovibrio TaxID=2627060 RepID=UPI0007AE7ABE|nr:MULTISPECIES: GNAT family N-acetyltransferase [unclassified Pseudovibrio]KZK79549.1 aminoalkylphosphonic acid N-acetyltransferase [Pseudovibrio sp. Ad46]KZL05820.1 aminoalkylphosphonic acid N-acetyltransferase [Pseudovibrio sp. Ad26]